MEFRDRIILNGQIRLLKDSGELLIDIVERLKTFDGEDILKLGKRSCALVRGVANLGKDANYAEVKWIISDRIVDVADIHKKEIKECSGNLVLDICNDVLNIGDIGIAGILKRHENKFVQIEISMYHNKALN